MYEHGELSDSDQDLDDEFIEFEEPEEDQVVQIFEGDQLVAEQQEVVKNVAELLNVTPSAACQVLRHFKWNYEELSQRYFEDPSALRDTLGINLGKVKPYITATVPTECNVCFDECPPDTILRMQCGHWFCKECWTGYLSGKVEQGPSCVVTHCAYPKCLQSVDETMFEEFLPEDLFTKYRTFVTRSFVEDNPRIRWCPGTDCDKAILCRDPNKLLVQCLCGYRSCFHCGLEAHAPVKCSDLRAWQLKEKGEGENSKWVFANTKACPECQSPIQKNDGCNHMTCTKCRHEFCWVCTLDWKKHGSSWYNCNFYNPGKATAEETDKGKVREELKRYMFYYERYIEHHKSKAFNQQDINKAQEKAEEFHQESPGWNTEYILKAVHQLVENREMLQYTYVYAYNLDKDAKMKPLFEYNQAALEKTTEDLNRLVTSILTEKNLTKLRHDSEFSREKVSDLTAIARNQLHKLLQGVYNPEDDAVMHVPAPSHTRPQPPHSAPLTATGSKDQVSFESKVAELVSMGFAHDHCVSVLGSCLGNVTEATELLLAMME
eukprot:NODE_242_length_1945_cov_224.710970_g192_i0.p1 GENE.NODE_242_length_1945_cov_224.710970_g192_i0~~NODE_242_length_1945_cov_224.710970_g192_i0.p1  ORF type:complete len:548 (+),score=98.91 NODE_242_length_1945_cov_224.710970_g192_i0:142-1785(+)